MEQEPCAQSVLPSDDLGRHHLFDVLAGNPPGALLFLLAARNTDATHYYLDLGKALVQAEDVPRGDELYGPRLAQNQAYRLSFRNGYFRAVLPPEVYRVNPDFLPYKRMLATALLDIEIDFPKISVGRIVGTNLLNPRQIGVPSLSMALYRMLLSSPDQTIPRVPVAEDFAGQTLLHDHHKRAYTRIKTLTVFGILEKSNNSRVRLCADALPFIAELLRRMDTLHANAENPATQQSAIKQAEDRAEEILASPAAVRAALRKVIKQARKELRQARPKSAVPVGTGTKSRPVTIELGTYPFDWLARAACKDANPTLFVLGSGSKSDVWKVKRAQKFCKSCSVTAPCLKQALLADDQHSIAALTPDERSALTENQKKQYIEKIRIVPLRTKARETS